MVNKNSVPGNVSSYDIGNIPFNHDVGRGKWATKWDFYAVSLSHCFGLRHFLLHGLIGRSSGFVLLISYMLGMLTFILPLYFIQMFMGQFSSTGSISAFRIAPLFKGIGYLSLFLNLLTCSYAMVTAAFPLYIIFQSMQSYLPWQYCNNTYNSQDCVIPQDIVVSNLTTTTIGTQTLAMHEYLKHFVNLDRLPGWNFSWGIIICTFVVWALIGLLLCRGVEMFGKILRFTTVTMLICILITTFRILHEENWLSLQQFFSFNFITFNYVECLIASPLLTLTAFGMGWGNVLTIASYNNFNEDIGKLSIVTCSIQMIVFLITALNYIAVGKYLREHYNYFYFNNLTEDTNIFLFLSYGFYFTHISWPQFWTILFFLGIFLSQLAEGAIQILSILTAIFDEYEYTRIYKKIILAGLVSCFGLFSVLFCTKNGFLSTSRLFVLSGVNKLTIVLIELLVVLWIYGRVRLQRDIKFMSGKQIKTWIIWMMRTLTPALAVLSLGYFLMVSYYQFMYGFILILFIFLILKLLPFIFVPGYMIYKIYTATGGILDRIRKLCRPNDWYPADPIDHQNYENYLGNSDIANELVHENIRNDYMVY